MASSIPIASTKVMFGITKTNFIREGFTAIIFFEPDLSGTDCLIKSFGNRLDALVWGTQKIKEWRQNGGTGILELKGIPELGLMNPHKRKISMRKNNMSPIRRNSSLKRFIAKSWSGNTLFIQTPFSKENLLNLLSRNNFEATEILEGNVLDSAFLVGVKSPGFSFTEPFFARSEEEAIQKAQEYLKEAEIFRPKIEFVESMELLEIS